MRNLFIPAFLMLMSATIPIAAEPQKRSHSPDVQRIFDRGELVVALYANDTYPLFYTASDGSLQGFDIDLAQRIAAELGVSVRFDRSAPTTDGVLDVVLDGRADMGISMVSMTSTRALRCRFSEPYLVLQPVLVQSRLLQETDSLVFAEREGTSYIDVARLLYPSSSVITMPDWDTASQAVLDGTAHAMLRDEIGVHNFMRDKRRLALRLQFTPVTTVQDNIGIVLPLESAQLENWLNVFLRMNGYPKNASFVIENYGAK